MILYDSAKTSMEIERSLLENFLQDHPRTIEDARNIKLPGENIYTITIIVEQVEPPL